MAKVKQLSRQGWRLQKALREVEEWNSWIKQSAELFAKELSANEPTEGEFTASQKEGINAVRSELTSLQEISKKLEKDLRRAFGRRLRRKAA